MAAFAGRSAHEREGDKMSMVQPVTKASALIRGWASGAHLSRRSVRLRLTVLYGCLFLLSGAVLLAITYLLVRHATGHVVLFRGSGHGVALFSGRGIPRQLLPQAQQLEQAAEHQHASELHQLLLQSGFALAIMAVVSVGLGWLIAGRALRPLRTMTQTTRRISQHNLHERLALRGPRDELKELADTIDGLLARLEQAFEAQRRFVANASHELRTPLTMMRTSLDVAAAKPERRAEQIESLDVKLREGLDRADQLLESFLTLARAEVGSTIEEMTVSLSKLVESALGVRAEAITDQQLNLEQTLDQVQVQGSETLLQRMVENVIDNAVRHNQPGGFIRVETQQVRDRARLLVETGGPQLDEAAVRQLVQPFQRLAGERTSDSRNGVGLGLSIVAAVASAHDGRLELRARHEGGLQVVVDLPCASNAAAV